MKTHTNLDGSTISVPVSATIGERAVIGRGAVIQTLFRTDGYCFALVPLADGGHRVTAGCCDFTPAEAREHWTTTRGGTPVGDETLALLDAFDAVIAWRRKA